MSVGWRIGCVLLWIGAIVGLGLAYMTMPPSPDQSQFDWMAFTALQGAPYYSGSFDMNWPGAMWLHEIGLRVFGVQAWTWRLTDFLFMLLFALGGAAFLNRSHWPLAAVIFVALYPPIYVTAGWWMAGQRDIIAAGFLILGCACAVPGRRNEGIMAFLAGLCIGYAVLIRPTYLTFLAWIVLMESLPLAITEARRCTRMGRALRFCAGFGVTIGGAVGFALMLGNLDDWYQQSVQFSLSVYVGDPPQSWQATLTRLFLGEWHWITALAILGIAAWIRRDRVVYSLVLLMGILFTAGLSFTFQNKGFGYHLGGVLPVLVLLLAIGLEGLEHWRRSSSGAVRRVAIGVLACAALLTGAGLASKMTQLKGPVAILAADGVKLQDGFDLTEAERQQVINVIQAGSSPQDSIAIYGTNYELAFRAKRLPHYRFFTPAADLLHPEFVHYKGWLNEIDTALAARAPAFVIIARRSITGIQPPVPRLDRPIITRLTALLTQNYTVVFESDALVVYGYDI